MQIATHTTHLSSLSSLLLSFLPADLLQTLPPPSAPHGYPASSTPSSALARRQAFDYPPSAYPGPGSTTRLNAAVGMARDHYDYSARAQGGVTRAPTVKKRVQQHGLGQGQTMYHGGTDTEFNFAHAAAGRPMGSASAHAHGDRQPTQKELKERDPNHRHPNQYTKKKLAQGSSVPMGPGDSTTSAGPAPSGRAAAYDGATSGGESAKARRGAESSTAAGASAGPSTAGRHSGASAGAGQLYPGMASREEYAAATAGGRVQKRKIDDAAVVSKRRKTTRCVAPCPCAWHETRSSQ